MPVLVLTVGKYDHGVDAVERAGIGRPTVEGDPGVEAGHTVEGLLQQQDPRVVFVKSGSVAGLAGNEQYIFLRVSFPCSRPISRARRRRRKGRGLGFMAAGLVSLVER